MPTFAGDYIQEPADLRIAGVTERTLIVACDVPPEGGTVSTAKRLEDVDDADRRAAIIAEADAVIDIAEDELNGYAERRGYAIPLSPVVATVKDLTSRICAVIFNLRAGKIDAAEAERQRNALRSGSLKDLAEGRLVLQGVTLNSSPTSAASSIVYGVSDAASRDANGRVPRFNRTTLERW